MAVLDTEGILAGWMYDELKSRGTASRRFEYEIEMNGEAGTAWRVTVGEERYELTADDHAGIFVTGVYSGSAEGLNHPYVNLFEPEGEQKQ